MIRRAIHIGMTMMLVIYCMCAVLPAHAEVSAKEAERLKKDLTPLGAERAGNADGTIPAWDGGMTGIPDNVTYDPEAGELHPDPYPDDKVLFSITAQNMDKYKDKLSEGIQALFKKYPDTFRIDVYPTRRPACAPQWVYDNTYKNALNGKLIGDGSDGFKGAHAGTPFPIPHNGCEAQYNHQYRWGGTGEVDINCTFQVHDDGSRVKGSSGIFTYLKYYYSETEEEFKKRGGWSSGALLEYFEPARRKGEIVLGLRRVEYQTQDDATWTYMPGQRRVRRAPSIGYDTPNPAFGGYGTYDDSYLFTSRPDRFDWKLVGKREMYVPYNNYANEFASLDDLLTPYHMNPKYFRWELHRVWEIEATLKEGARHCYGRRVFFADEDSWIFLLNQQYDTRGTLWRTGIACSKMFYDVPCLHQRAQYLFDLQVTTYIATMLNQGMPRNTYQIVSPPEMFTPQYVRKLGKR